MNTKLSESSGAKSRPFQRAIVRAWPWWILGTLALVAVWEYCVPETGFDSEFPTVVRSTYNALPPAVYRISEPGDTLDRAALYAAAGGFVAALLGWRTSRKTLGRSSLWPVLAGLFLLCGWHAATPRPTVDGWYGLNWYAMADAATPPFVRWALGIALALLVAWSGFWLWRERAHWRQDLLASWRHGSLPLFVLGGVGVVWRLARLPDGEPYGYWSGWGFGLGLIAMGLGLLREVPEWPPVVWRRCATTAGWLAASLVLCALGRYVIWYHRPLERLRPVVPGAIYISAMPTYRGLEIAHARHKFRTIINVFNEDTPQRSPLLPDELRFVREHGIRYLAAPSDTTRSDAFLDETLRLAQDPEAWPILLHCHGCMDRSPAWMGIYRFLVEHRPLKEILKEIEAHRGVRPKALVTLLYNRALPRRDPARYAADPTAQELRRNAQDSEDPYVTEYSAPLAEPAGEPGVRERESAAERLTTTLTHPAGQIE